MTLPKIYKYKCNENLRESCFISKGISEPYICSICAKKFSTKDRLIIHINSHNFIDNELDDKNETQNTCKICSKKFTAKKNLLKHLRHVHKNFSEAQRILVKKIKCPERNCEFLCRMMKELRNHIEKSHNIKILTDTLQFPNEAAFQKWKKEEESNTVSWFVTGRKKTTLTDGTKKQILYCHRSGHYSPKGFGKYRMRSVGSCKIGVTCPATMEVTESSKGELTVVYYKTHLGHLQDVVYLKLTREEKGHLAEKINQGFSFDAILEDVKESISMNNEKKKRIHLLSKKDLYSIMYRSTNSDNRKKIKKSNEESLHIKTLKPEENKVVLQNLPVERMKTEGNICQNFAFYSSHSSAVSSQERPKFILESLNVSPQQKEHVDLNIPQSSAEGITSQIVILSPDIDYSSVAEIILLSGNDGASAQSDVISQTKMETLQHQGTFNAETQTPMSGKILTQHKTKANKSNLYLYLKEKLHRITEYLPRSEYLTPKQFNLINTKLDGVLDIFNVVNEKAKTRKHNLKRKKMKRNKTLTTITNARHEIENNLYKNQGQKHCESQSIYAV